MIGDSLKEKVFPDFSKPDGLIPTVVQSYITKEVLMLAYMNEESYRRSLESGFVTFYSRSRNSIWVKGETSGNFLIIKNISIDCDLDTILIQAEPKGPSCHTGSDTCFFNEVLNENKNNHHQLFSLQRLEEIIQARKIEGSSSSYTNSLFKMGINKITQKVGEEANEVVIAALAESNDKLLEESADLIFHFLVLLNEKGLSLKDVEKVLCKRASL